MPVTPFHFGPALLVKAAAPRRFSLAAFAFSQFVIDCETVYHVLRDEWPLHRDLHTFAGALVAGLAAGLAVVLARAALRVPAERPVLGFPGELGLAACLIGGAFGGVSHVVLDGIMHSDVRPFAPWVDGNPYHRALPLAELHALCVVTGAIGLALLWLRRAHFAGPPGGSG